MIRITFFAAFGLGMAISMRSDVALSNGLCLASETSFFGCQTANKRWIGLCGAMPGKLQYRFGTPGGRIEFRYPENPADGTSRYRYAHYSRFQTERIEVTFKNQGVDYAIFDYTESQIRRAGVRVTTREGKEQEFVCAARLTSQLSALQPVLQCDANNALNGGDCP